MIIGEGPQWASLKIYIDELNNKVVCKSIGGWVVSLVINFINSK